MISNISDSHFEYELNGFLYSETRFISFRKKNTDVF
jgi:hypothetical protein